MTEKNFDIVEYMSKGVERVVKNAIRATLTNPMESLFLAKFAAASVAAAKKRAKAKDMGEHVPAFLIASITSSCNLHCAGCYSRANHACQDSEPVSQLTTDDWKRIFDEAEAMGVSFILLAGGEPLLRQDVIEAAGKISNIMFPVFTNGTMIGEKYAEIFRKSRNLFPVISIEGHEQNTDNRRGDGVYSLVTSSMDLLKSSGILFGTSVTVTTENMQEAYSDSFIENLAEKGCKAVFYIEFVPVTEESRHLAPKDTERAYMNSQMMRIRAKYPEMVFVSFPGDEKSSGGCVAAGRGFFHINSHGGAEPCPFSPYSDVNVKDTSLKEALHSELFRKLRDNGTLMEEHEGGCILFEKKEEVEKYLK